ncbi:MAG: hypothetical protein AAF266_06880 [Planctomycetota bacterium]
MNRFAATLLIGALAAAPAAAQLGVTYTENFDDGAASTRWSAPVIDAETGVFDGAVDYAFDYGAIGIPAAPGGGSATGVLFQANLSDAGAVDEGEAIAIVPTVGGELPNAPYRLSVQAYFNVEAQNSGTTEFGLFGVHAAAFNAPGDAGLNDDVPFDFGVSNGNGLAYMASGDSGASNDFHRYEDAGNLNAGSQTGLGSYDDRDGQFTNITDPINEGPRGQWIEIAIERDGPFVSFIVDGAVIDTIDNGDDFSDGTILLGYADYFNSVGVPTFEVGPDPTPFDDSDGPFGDQFAGLAHFLILDNVVVETIVPEPTSAVIAVVALGGLVTRRRR